MVGGGGGGLGVTCDGTTGDVQRGGRGRRDEGIMRRYYRGCTEGGEGEEG